MKPIALIMFACALLPRMSLGYEPDVTQERMEDVAEEVDHLIPSGSTMPEERPLHYIAKFGQYPSFSSAFEWCLLKNERRYILSSWRLERGSKTGVKPSRVETTEIEVSVQIAAAIYEIWANEILNARYARQSLGKDGTSYSFSTYLRGVGWPSAETWSPMRDSPPKWLVNVGEDVLAYARSERRDERQLLAQLSATSTRLTEYRRAKNASAWPNNRLEFARTARPTRKSLAPLLAAQAGR